MPVLSMGDGDPPQHLREFFIMSGPDEVLVIGHQAIGRDTDAGLGVGPD